MKDDSNYVRTEIDILFFEAQDIITASKWDAVLHPDDNYDKNSWT